MQGGSSEKYELESASSSLLPPPPSGRNTVLVLRPFGKYAALMPEIYVNTGIHNEMTLCRQSFTPPPKQSEEDTHQASTHPIAMISRKAHVSISTNGMGKVFVKDLSGRVNVHINSRATTIGELKINDSFSLLPANHFEYKLETITSAVDSSPSSSSKTTSREKRQLSSNSPGSDIEIVNVPSPRKKKKSKVMEELMIEMDCPICYVPLAYSYMMPCQHTYCYECLKDHADSSHARTANYSGTFACPECSKATKMKDCVHNLKVDKLVEVLLADEGGTDYDYYKLRCEYGKELHKNPNTTKPRPKLPETKAFVPIKTTNAALVAREQKRANRKANRSQIVAAAGDVFDLTLD